MIVEITMCNTLNTAAQWNPSRCLGIIIIIKRDSAWDDWSLYLSLLVWVVSQNEKKKKNTWPINTLGFQCRQNISAIFQPVLRKQYLCTVLGLERHVYLRCKTLEWIWNCIHHWGIQCEMQGSVLFTHCKNVSRFGWLQWILCDRQVKKVWFKLWKRDHPNHHVLLILKEANKNPVQSNHALPINVHHVSWLKGSIIHLLLLM